MKQHNKEFSEYRQFTGPAEQHKAINTLRGIIAGITSADGVNAAEVAELANWITLHKQWANHHPFNEIFPLAKEILSDGVIDDEEVQDLLWLSNNFISDNSYYNMVTSSLQFLSGMLHGFLADTVLTEGEIRMLNKWISNSEFLRGCYPFDEIEGLLLNVLVDGKVTQDEIDMLFAFFSEFVDVSASYNLNEYDIKTFQDKYDIKGVCVPAQELDISGHVFCFTGKSSRVKRDEFAEIVERYGGSFKKSIVDNLDYLVVGDSSNPCWAYSCYGRKIEDVMNRRKNGSKILIINESDFWDAVEDYSGGE